MKPTLQLAVNSDIPIIADLAQRIWISHYVPIIGKAQVDYMLDKMYSEKSLSEQMNSGQQFYLARLDKIPVGYISVSEKSDGEFFMHKFYMEVKEQGKGLGKQLFTELISKFPQLKLMRLQVNRMNIKTINFYFRVGFAIEEAKIFDIGDGFFMDDYVMIFRK